MITRHILIASNNLHKQKEFREIFDSAELGSGVQIVLHSPRELGMTLDPDESADTYVGNSQIKARAFYAAVCDTPPLAEPLWVMADDSGLEVDALGGRPGVLSARYHKAAPNGDGCAELLREMVDVPDAQRTARFHAVIVLISPDGQETVVHGICEGRISHESRGRDGFGFDPVFLVAAHQHERTMAELSSAEKHRVSHRGLAAKQLEILSPKS